MSGEDSGEMIIIDSADDNPTSATSVPEFVIMTMQEAKSQYDKKIACNKDGKVQYVELDQDDLIDINEKITFLREHNLAQTDTILINTITKSLPRSRIRCTNLFELFNRYYTVYNAFNTDFFELEDSFYSQEEEEEEGGLAKQQKSENESKSENVSEIYACGLIEDPDENSLVISAIHLEKNKKTANDFNIELFDYLGKNYEKDIEKMSSDTSNDVFNYALKIGIKDAVEFKALMMGENPGCTLFEFVDNRNEFSRFFMSSHLLVKYVIDINFKSTRDFTRKAFGAVDGLSISYLRTAGVRIACALLLCDDVSLWIGEFVSLSKNVPLSIHNLIAKRNLLLKKKISEVSTVVAKRKKKITKLSSPAEDLELLAMKEYDRTELPNHDFQQLESNVLREINLFGALGSLSVRDDVGKKENKKFIDLKNFFYKTANILHVVTHEQKSVLDLLTMSQHIVSPKFVNNGITGDGAAAVQCAETGLIETSSTFKSIDDRGKESSQTLVYYIANRLWLVYAYLLNDKCYEQIIRNISIVDHQDQIIDMLGELRRLFFTHLPQKKAGDVTDDEVTDAFLKIHENENNVISETIRLLETKIVTTTFDGSFENFLFERVRQNDIKTTDFGKKIELHKNWFAIKSKYVETVMRRSGRLDLKDLCMTLIDDSLHDSKGELVKTAALKKIIVAELLLSMGFELRMTYDEIKSNMRDHECLVKLVSILFPRSTDYTDILDIFLKIIRPVFKRFYYLDDDIDIFDKFITKLIKDYKEYQDLHKDIDTKYNVFRKRIGDMLSSRFNMTEKTLDDANFTEDFNFFEEVCALGDVPDCAKVCFHALSLLILQQADKSEMDLQNRFLKNFNGTVVFKSIDSVDKVLVCSSSSFFTTPAQKSEKRTNDGLKVMVKKTEPKENNIDEKFEIIVESVSIFRLLADCHIRTDHVVCNVDYSTDSFKSTTIVGTSLPQDAAPAAERVCTIANIAHFYPLVPSCRGNDLSIFLPLTLTSLKKLIEPTIDSNTNSNVENDIILSVISRMELTVSGWSRLIQIINNYMPVLRTKIETVVLELQDTMNDGGDEPEDIIAISEETSVAMQQLDTQVEKTGAGPILKNRLNDYFRNLNSKISRNIEKFPILTQVFDWFKYKVFTIITEYSKNKVENFDDIMGSYKIQYGRSGTRSKGGAAPKIVEEMVINEMSALDKSSVNGDFYEKIAKDDIFEESTKTKSPSEFEISNEMMKIIESINAKTRSEKEIYLKMEKYKKSTFGKMKLENGDDLYVAKYGFFTVIDENGRFMMIPIKTEEQLIDMQEVEEYFKPLHPDTHIGGKGRRANRDAIKPKKTKKRASTTPLKRVTKNKNKNNNGNNNKKSEKKKKNKKNHHNDRKKTRR